MLYCKVIAKGILDPDYNFKGIFQHELMLNRALWWAIVVTKEPGSRACLYVGVGN